MRHKVGLCMHGCKRLVTYVNICCVCLFVSRAAPRPKHPRTSSSTSHPHSATPTSATLSLSSLPNVTLETGMNVFVTGADFGTVRFIGHTSFSEGVWLGIELRKPSKFCQVCQFSWNIPQFLFSISPSLSLPFPSHSLTIVPSLPPFVLILLPLSPTLPLSLLPFTLSKMVKTMAPWKASDTSTANHPTDYLWNPKKPLIVELTVPKYCPPLY